MICDKTGIKPLFEDVDFRIPLRSEAFNELFHRAETTEAFIELLQNFLRFRRENNPTSWDPQRAIIVYQPVDFYERAVKIVAKSIDTFNTRFKAWGEVLSLYKPTPNSEEMRLNIRMIQVIKSDISDCAKILMLKTRGFERPLALEMAHLQQTIAVLNAACDISLCSHKIAFISAVVFSKFAK